MTASVSSTCVSLSPLSLFKCLAEETRLKTLLMLCVKDELCVCDLTEALNLSQPKISRHLADLRKCELVADERRGKWVYYRLNPALPAWAKEVLHLSASSNAEYIKDALNNLKCDTDC
ncbi:ArsR family transcriptional regulator [Alteromonas stellipolaris]|jgi:ArsR family transcriptional regulator|uniref:metalloregulator ArsR/SmtB family transcription factor n=2 Tax=Alteromonas stellipolaris TaxID=233316 RepID=UPI00076FF7A7|nr:metalloregulator ArsR/SmtB family transcription factor [Alteromonas stellipolaris]AMJ95583.1 ArsR family transcriptional regulator [Alteromonas stellipolaris]